MWICYEFIYFHRCSGWVGPTPSWMWSFPNGAKELTALSHWMSSTSDDALPPAPELHCHTVFAISFDTEAVDTAVGVPLESHSKSKGAVSPGGVSTVTPLQTGCIATSLGSKPFPKCRNYLLCFPCDVMYLGISHDVMYLRIWSLHGAPGDFASSHCLGQGHQMRSLHPACPLQIDF